MKEIAATFDADGFAVAPDAFSESQCVELEAHVRAVDIDGAGRRELLSFDWARRFARQLRELPSLADLLRERHTASQCTCFAKVAARNWLVALHQDLHRDYSASSSLGRSGLSDASTRCYRDALATASSKSASDASRRVLHYLSGATELLSGLRWKHAF